MKQTPNLVKQTFANGVRTKAEDYLQRLVDAFYTRWPQPRPAPARLAQGRIISHRGEHDNRTVLENTIAAFAQAEAAGVWGIELDVRWTHDLVAVVAHDPDLKRLYGFARPIRETSYAHLKAHCPAVPGLADIVARFGRRLHLMIELKDHLPVDSELQHQRLGQVLAPLTPVRDYHLMALDARILQQFDAFPPRCRVAIAYYWPVNLSRWVAANQWGGLCSHYFLMPAHIIRKHHSLGQCIGTGYAASRYSLFRELNRGIDWIFSNQAARMQKELHAARQLAGILG